MFQLIWQGSGFMSLLALHRGPLLFEAQRTDEREASASSTLVSASSRARALCVCRAVAWWLLKRCAFCKDRICLCPLLVVRGWCFWLQRHSDFLKRENHWGVDQTVIVLLNFFTCSLGLCHSPSIKTAKGFLREECVTSNMKPFLKLCFYGLLFRK